MEDAFVAGIRPYNLALTREHAVECKRAEFASLLDSIRRRANGDQISQVQCKIIEEVQAVNVSGLLGRALIGVSSVSLHFGHSLQRSILGTTLPETATELPRTKYLNLLLNLSWD